MSATSSRTLHMPAWPETALAVFRAAQAVARPGGPRVFEELVQELASILEAELVYVAVFTDETRRHMSTLAVALDGQIAPNFNYALDGTPCDHVIRQLSYLYMPSTIESGFGALDFRLPGRGPMNAYAAFPLEDAVGAPLGLLVAANDKPYSDASLAEALLKIFAGRIGAEIERQRVEEELRRREEQYRVIFDGSADPMVLWNRDMIRVDVNTAFLELFGYAREEAIGARLTTTSIEALELRLEKMRAALNGRKGRLESIAVRKDGSTFDIELRYLPITYRGEPHVLAIGRDITERREHERALQRSKARLRATVEAAFDCIVATDGGGRILEWNAAAERCFGLRRDEVMGRMLVDVIVPARLRAELAGGAGRFFAHGDKPPPFGTLVETTAVRADGSEFPIELAMSAAQLPEGPLYVSHMRDVTARHRAEEQRAALEAQLRQAQKMEAIGQLTGGIAHDFNNILTSVVGYGVMARERAAALGDDNLVRQLDQAHQAAKRASDLIAQMLAFARQRRGVRRVIALAPAVRQTVQLLRATLPASIDIEALELNADSEEATDRVEADAVQIEQVIFNLCLNARDAMTDGGHIRINLRSGVMPKMFCASCHASLTPGPWVELSVADNGSGIAPEVMERMFDPFFTTKEVGRGSGMGLAMVHGIVHEHGGHVAVETRPGAGSVFRVLLPPARDDKPPPAPKIRKSFARQSLSGRVLVVEDELMVGDFMIELLRSWGLEVVRYNNPLAALDWLNNERNTVDVLLTDQTMPHLTGLELARRSREMRPALPVLLYSGQAEALDRSAVKSLGIRALLGKPVDADALHAALRRSLGGS